MRIRQWKIERGNASRAPEYHPLLRELIGQSATTETRTAARDFTCAAALQFAGPSCAFHLQTGQVRPNQSHYLQFVSMSRGHLSQAIIVVVVARVCFLPSQLEASRQLQLTTAQAAIR